MGVRVGDWRQFQVKYFEAVQPNKFSKVLVVVLRHGLLATVPYYFFDMEKFGHIPWKPAAWEEMLTTYSGGIDVNSRMKQVWAIMSHVASGLHYIHMHQEIHRDLKPRNSPPPSFDIF